MLLPPLPHQLHQPIHQGVQRHVGVERGGGVVQVHRAARQELHHVHHLVRTVAIVHGDAEDVVFHQRAGETQVINGMRDGIAQELQGRDGFHPNLVAHMRALVGHLGRIVNILVGVGPRRGARRRPDRAVVLHIGVAGRAGVHWKRSLPQPPPLHSRELFRSLDVEAVRAGVEESVHAHEVEDLGEGTARHDPRRIQKRQAFKQPPVPLR
eukprot:scaffold764_cov248-Pinguiococcus_pyrenoidosus.AAC.10